MWRVDSWLLGADYSCWECLYLLDQNAVLRVEFRSIWGGRVDGSRATQFVLKLFVVYEDHFPYIEVYLNHWDSLHM